MPAVLSTLRKLLMKVMMRSILFLFIVFILRIATMNAQDYRATILGTVTDPSGAAVPGAQLLVTNTDTGIVSKAVSNNDGPSQFHHLCLERTPCKCRRMGSTLEYVPNV